MKWNDVNECCPYVGNIYLVVAGLDICIAKADRVDDAYFWECVETNEVIKGVDYFAPIPPGPK